MTTRIAVALAILVHDEAGQDLIEYGLLAAFISLSATAAILLIGTNLSSTYSSFNGPVSQAAGS